MSARWYVGIDGGGSGSRGRLYDESGKQVAEVSAGPANIATDIVGAQNAVRSIVRSLCSDVTGVEPEDCHVGLGLAGAQVHSVRDSFLAGGFPFASVRLVSDAHASALGAFGGQDGGVVAVGTGAVACAVHEGEVDEIGGFGFCLDDRGAGADVGRQALRAALREFDTGPDLSTFGRALLEPFDQDSWRVIEWSTRARPGELAAVAPTVFDFADEGDDTARAIVHASVAEVLRLIELVRAHGASRVCLVGSIGRRVRRWLPSYVVDSLEDPEGDAIDGAHYAIRHGLGHGPAVLMPRGVAATKERSTMSREIDEIPAVVARQVGELAPLYEEIGASLRRSDPKTVVTCARGSSDHAARYFQYLTGIRLGLPVASIGPSLASVYSSPLRLEGGLCVAVSQSGKSPDLIALQAAARAGGGRCLAVVNVEDSPLADKADLVAPLGAGPEVAVAATKSFVSSLVALASIVASWAEDEELQEGLKALPEALDRALDVDLSRAFEHVRVGSSSFTLGRGPGLAVSDEAALKLKEVCRAHAESFSAAEVLHGPIAIADGVFSALAFGSADEGETSVIDAVDRLRATGARVHLLDSTEQGVDVLRTVAAPHPLLNPVVQITSFYRAIEQRAAQLGLDADKPAHLKKVTETR